MSAPHAYTQARAATSLKPFWDVQSSIDAHLAASGFGFLQGGLSGLAVGG